RLADIDPDHRPQLRPHGVATTAHHGPARTGWPRPKCDVGQLMDPLCAPFFNSIALAGSRHSLESLPNIRATAERYPDVLSRCLYANRQGHLYSGFACVL
ncbi:hypothetical protein CCUS01_16196, partial [Colletotrichum cuscutae]